eukprot:gene9743-9901_t
MVLLRVLVCIHRTVVERGGFALSVCCNHNPWLALIAAAFVTGLGAGVYFDAEINLSPNQVASTEIIDRRTPNAEVCMAYGYSAMVFDQRVFVTYNPFNLYVTQPEVKPGCILRRSNVSVLERDNLVTGKQAAPGRVAGCVVVVVIVVVMVVVVVGHKASEHLSIYRGLLVAVESHCQNAVYIIKDLQVRTSMVKHTAAAARVLTEIEAKRISSDTSAAALRMWDSGCYDLSGLRHL